MKAKQLLFVLFLLIQTVAIGTYATTETDDIDYSALGITDDNGIETVSGVSVVSGAQYSGLIESQSGDLVLLDGESVLATSESGGFVKSITIYWSSTAAYSEVDEVTIYAKNSAYAGTEVSGGGDEIETILCDGSASQTYDFETNYSNFALISAYEAHISHIEVVWTLRSDYAITKVADHGTIAGATSAYAGDVVSLSMTRSSGYAMTGYTVYKTGDPSTEVTDVTYSPVTAAQTITFTMPAYAVTVEGKFVTEPSTTLVPTVKDGSGNNLNALSAMTSGTTLVYNYSVPSDYTGDVSASTSDATKAQVSVIKTNAYSGRLVIRVYQKGKVKVTLSFTADTKYKKRDINSKSATVSAQEVVLVTELNGRHYAVTQAVLGATTEAQELIKQGANYYYKTGVDPNDIKWYLEDMGSGVYLSNSSDEYLTVDAATMSLSATPYKWSENAAGVYINGYLTGLCIDEDYDAFTVNNQNDFKTISTISAPIHSVSASSLSAATEYTRGVTSGNYATICLPFPVSRSDEFFSGVDVYNVTGKHMSGVNVTGIELEEETGALVAGKPYIIQATASELSAWYGVATAESPVSATGLVGNLGDAYFIPVGGYIISSNKIRRVAYANTGKVGQNKAYLDLSAVPTVGGSSAPGRRVIYSETVADAATALDDFLAGATEINWNEPVYNMLGQQVGKGTKGVLIQNGQKFLVQ